MKNGRTLFLLTMGMVVSLYTAFVVIGQDDAAVDAKGTEAAAVEEASEDVVPSDEAVPADDVMVEKTAAEEATASEEVTVVEPAADDTRQLPSDDAGAVEEPSDTETGAVSNDRKVPEDGQGEAFFVGVDDNTGDADGVTAEKNEDETISISLDDVPMTQVVSMFTRISGANIIASPSNLLGNVTANLEDVQWHDAMTTILDMHNLQLTEQPAGSGIYRIDPKLPGAPDPLEVQTFFLKYAQVSNSTAVISSMLTAGATLQPFPSRNALVVRSTARNLDEIKEIIKSIDVLRDQVFIEAKFMELNDTAIKDLGINWQVLQGYNVGVGSLAWNVTENRNWDKTVDDTVTMEEGRTRQEGVVKAFNEKNDEYESGDLLSPAVESTLLAGTVPTYSYSDVIDKSLEKKSESSDAFTKGIADVRTAVLGVDDFRLVLSALKQMDGVQVVSNPKIIVANEEAALIHIGQEERPFESVVTPATQTTAPLVTYNPGAPVQLGVKLMVVPTINTESNITVRIEPELTRFIRDSVAPNGQTYPIIGKKTIKTMFCLESGKTVAIGGLTETVESQATKKIPLLGDIPLIGKYLFSHEHTEKEQKETIIFVTVGLAKPESVTEMDGLPEDTELTHNKLLESKLRHHNFKADLEVRRREIEEQIQGPNKSDRTRHLLKSK